MCRSLDNDTEVNFKGLVSKNKKKLLQDFMYQQDLLRALEYNFFSPRLKMMSTFCQIGIFFDTYSNLYSMGHHTLNSQVSAFSRNVSL